MKVLTFSSLWPNPMQPLHGLFVRERVKALSGFYPVRIAAPVPWFIPVKWLSEQYYRYTQVPQYERQGILDVVHPRYLVLPKIMKWLDGWLMYASLRSRIKQIQSEFPFDLIDAHWAYPDGFAASRIAGELSVPFTITVRGSDINVFAQEKLRRALIRRSLQEAQHVICVARSLKEAVIGLGVAPDKVAVVENGIDPRKFHPIPREEARRYLQLSRNGRIVLSVGHLSELKGFHLLIAAIQNLRASGKAADSDVKLIIVGGTAAWDSYYDVLTQQIEKHKLQDFVVLAGPKAPEELKFWYSAADVFCLASAREGCPNVVLESLACGTPVVATAVGGIPDILHSPELGILVERNVNSIQQGISEAMGRCWNHGHISEHALENYSWEQAAAKICKIFEASLKAYSANPGIAG